MIGSTAWDDANVVAATSVQEAVATLERLGERAAPLAGGTWIMRAPSRREQPCATYVDVRAIDELSVLDVAEDGARVGAGVTHQRLAALAPDGSLDVVREAAAASAFPAVRSVATVGGNIAAADFAEADLVPALLAADARVELASGDGRSVEPLADYLPRRTASGTPLIAAVVVPRAAGRRSAYERLTIRAGGEYAVAAVALSLDLDDDGVVVAARLALGAVEATARRFDAEAQALVGERAGAGPARAVGEAVGSACAARDDDAAPAWYRRTVLPVLVERAAARIAAGGAA
ncbi:FAD binding domain-containing protein [Conexibacter woesei]|uniref:Molybdopterin dehydrogenase FAD-binding protein n=1 Tax=Conexibacter woesei (strain DSM 14684 / CCUG 47730 / CIP 108061 / JCM 11494 / NBRC 100937 / ID131577) TaxID=469383 RepID=D3F4S3_CONWI|nr:FAD binding domain-containing protein [Conexibacter woesei]ADB52530.1 molybdopterin dehydrogenase FAD-binding protein [Conexibacter woesei DSM 14684]